MAETIIVEDSPVGLKAAYSSGANVIRVDNPKDLTYDNGILIPTKNFSKEFQDDILQYFRERKEDDF